MQIDELYIIKEKIGDSVYKIEIKEVTETTYLIKFCDQDTTVRCSKESFDYEYRIIEKLILSEEASKNLTKDTENG